MLDTTVRELKKVRQPKSIHEMSYGRIQFLGSGKTTEAYEPRHVRNQIRKLQIDTKKQQPKVEGASTKTATKKYKLPESTRPRGNFAC
jgi:50S ribosomal subunit-associated GTPase HflX